MKQITFPTRLNKLVTSVINTIALENELPTESALEKRFKNSKRQRPERKEFFYYMQLSDVDTKETVGHLADISSGGFKLDTQKPLPANKDFRLQMNLTAEVANKPSMVFTARSRWCRIDPIDPYTYNVGYQLLDISPEDLEIFNRMMEKYGKEYNKRNLNLRHSGKW